MYCSRCGFQNDPGAAFCSKCGAPAEQSEQPAQAPPAVPPLGGGPQPGYAPQPGYTPAAAYGPPPKKKRTGLIIGLIAGGVVLIGAAVAVALLVLSGPGLDGIWSCEDRGWVLAIEDGVMTEYSPAGTDTVRYAYDGGEGEAALQGGDASFTVKGGSLRLTDEAGDKYLFMRQEKDFDIEKTVLEGIEGLWSSEALGEVISLDGGVLYVYSGSGDYTGSYEYDIDDGEGTLTLAGGERGFSAGWDALNVDTIGSYARSEKGLDVATFIGRFANPLLATWYETTGMYGTITFAADGTFALEVYGKSFNGTYTYDPQTGSGSALLELNDEAEAFTYTDGVVTLDGVKYTQDYVEQPSAEDINAALAGTWYDTKLPEELIVFYNDGKVEVASGDTYYTGTYTFDPFEQNGVITLTDGTQSDDFEFKLEGDTLNLNGYSYTRQPTEAVTGSVLGTWYDVAGMQGTLYFDKDGLAIMESYGTFFYGTYAFDVAAGTGTMTLDFVDGPNTWNLYLLEGLLYTGDAVYTQEVVEQTTDTNAG